MGMRAISRWVRRCMMSIVLRIDPPYVCKGNPLEPEIIQLRELSLMWDRTDEGAYSICPSISGTGLALLLTIPRTWRESICLMVAGVTALCAYTGTCTTGLGLECSQGDEKHRIRRFSLEQVLQILRSRPVHAALGIVETTTRRIQPMVNRLVIFLYGLYI